MSHAAMRVSVVVPSFRRPASLSRCLAALARQERAPDEVLVAVRSDDAATICAVRAAKLDVARTVQVVTPGVLAAMQAGAGAATGDVIAFTDDDAAPRPDWLRRLEDHFAEPAVGAVGGRDVLANEIDNETTDVGRITSWGRLVGNQHLAIGRARPVDVLKGVNVAFRRPALALPHELRGRGSHVHWEIPTCAWARARGWRVIFDPAVVVDHIPAPRPAGDKRAGCAGDVRDASFNLVIGIASFRPELVWRRALYGLLLGDRMTPGLLRGAVGAARGEIDVARVTPAALLGQAQALLAFARGQRQLMVPVDRMERR
jgi:glycosyltransferase involved in cell wall biosynthesis